MKKCNTQGGPEIEDAMYNVQPYSQLVSFKDKAELEMEPDENAR